MRKKKPNTSDEFEKCLSISCEHAFDDTRAAQNRSRSELGAASAQPILTCQFDLAHFDSNKNGTLVPQLERRGESPSSTASSTMPTASSSPAIACARGARPSPPPPLRPCPGRAHEPPSAPNPVDLWTTQERASPTNPQVQQQQQASAYSVRNGVERVPTLDPHANPVSEIHRPASRRTPGRDHPGIPGRLRRNPHRCGDRTS
jgi:hypothetical protein